jgi:hypothetical protein
MRFAAFRRALAAVAGSALVASALLVTASAPAPAAATQPAATRPAASLPVVISCVGNPRVRPHQIVLACADGNDALPKLNWSHWRSQALATGTEAINDCTPSCVGGTFHKFAVITVLWRVRPRPHHSAQHMFTRATIIYTGKVPAGLHRTRTVPLFG